MFGADLYLVAESVDLLIHGCVPESRFSGAIPSDRAAAEVENSDQVGQSCWSAMG